jgi:hypothetical protein
MQAVPPALLKIKTDFNFVYLVFLMVSGSDLGLRISDKTISLEGGIDETNGLFRRNSG